MRRVEIEEQRIKDVVGILRAHEVDPEDQTWIDSLEGETDLMELSSQIVGRIAEIDGFDAAIKDRQRTLRERAERFGKQKEHLRAALVSLMEASDQSKLELPEATLSIRAIKPKRMVTDETAIPDEFWKVKREIDKTALNAADGEVPGTEWSNGGTSLTIRRA